MNSGVDLNPFPEPYKQKWYLISADNALSGIQEHGTVYTELPEPEGEGKFLMNLLESRAPSVGSSTVFLSDARRL